MSALFNVGTVSTVHCTLINSKHIGKAIVRSDGLIKHIAKRHPDCVSYIGVLPLIISSPDYIGVNPNETETSFTLVKCLSDNVQVGIKIDSSGEYFYVATIFKITSAKLKKNISNGRLTKV